MYIPQIESLYFNDLRTLWIGIAFFIFLSLFLFWHESKRVHRNRNSIFDFWLISAVSGLLGGRIEYIVANFQTLKNVPWFPIPYEKFNGEVYFLRLFPWRFFRFWDGGIIFSGMLLGFILAVYLLTIKKRGWRWDEMFVASFNAVIVLFDGVLLMIGLYSRSYAVVLLNLVIFALLIIFYIYRRLLAILSRDLHSQMVLFKIGYTIIVLSVDVVMLYLYFLSNVSVLWLEQISIAVFTIITGIMVIHFWVEKIGGLALGKPLEEEKDEMKILIGRRLKE
jgi:hypothetical protein